MNHASATLEKAVLRIGSHALPDIELTRFKALFQVAQTRSLVAWLSVPAAQAQVVVSHGQPWRGTRAVSLCIDPPASFLGDADVVPLASGFRVLSLIQALDEAALRVLRSAARPTEVSPIAYRLRHWVVLGADKQSGHHARVMAAMSRRALTREGMASGGGLSTTEIDALLSELRAHGALHEVAAEDARAPSAPATEKAPPVLASRPGLVGRLRQWFFNARAGESRPEPRT